MSRIALLEWNTGGHHPMYFRYFSAAIRQCGHDVVEFCPDSEEFRDELSGVERDLKEKRSYGGQVAFPKQLRFRPSRFCGPLNSIRRCCSINRSIRAWERRSSQKVDLLFFACFYDLEWHHFDVGQRWLRWPFTGLYLHARTLRCPGTEIPGTGFVPVPTTLFQGQQCRGIAILDEYRVKEMQALLSGKCVVSFPDPTIEFIAPETPELRKWKAEISSRAKGRRVVISPGFLQKSKGVLDLLEASQTERGAHYFFVFAGPLDSRSFSDSERQQISTAFTSQENILAISEKLSNEYLNALIVAADVIMAAYRDFPHSSNILSKAAALQKPVVVNGGYLMGDRVSDYRMGSILSSTSRNSICDSIDEVLESNWTSARNPLWKEYLAQHSASTLVNSMKMLLSDCLQSGK